MIKNKGQKGFSLIELILVMGLSSLALVSLIQWEVRKSEIVKAETAGEQFAEVGRALSAYIAKEQVNLAFNIPAGTSAIMSIEVLKGTASGFFVPHQYLPTSFSATSLFGIPYEIQIRHNVGGLIEGIIVSSAAICEKGTAAACPTATNPIRFDWIGAAMRKMGSQSGMARTATTLNGINGSWVATQANFSVIDTIGQLGYRVAATDTALFDAQYLRLDGMSTMSGNLNMGNYSIENATNISFNGWMQGYGILANTIRSGSINNTGDIQTTNLYATNILKVGSAPLPTNTSNISNGDIIADKNIYARDIYLGNDINHANRTKSETGHSVAAERSVPNVWLSDLLPKYSSRGVYRVDSGDVLTKPVCNGGGTPKIEVIPQVTYSHGRVYGENYLVSSGAGPTWEASIKWDLIAYNPNLAYATDAGTTWVVRFETSDYDGYMITGKDSTGAEYPYPLDMPNFTMSGLAHIYCDYNF